MKMMNSSGTKKALSLIELMILISLIALVSSVVFSKTSVFISKIKQKNEISKVLSYLNHLERLAALRKVPLEISFQEKGSFFSVNESLLKKNKVFKGLQINELSGLWSYFPPKDVYIEKSIKFRIKDEEFEFKYQNGKGFYLSN